MPFENRLGHRAMTAYNRLSRELAALNYVLRIVKPTGMVGASTLQSLNHALLTADRLFCREAELPRFGRLDPAKPLTMADFTILVTRLTAAALAFEERYAQLRAAPNPDYAREGLPSPHI